MRFLGSKLGLANWSSTVESSLESKIGAITKSGNGSNLLKDRPNIKRKVEELTTLRNDLIHYKYEFHTIVEIGGEKVSELYTRTGPDSLEEILKDIRKIIKLIHDYIRLRTPYWLEKQVDWLEETDPMHLLP